MTHAIDTTMSIATIETWAANNTTNKREMKMATVNTKRAAKGGEFGANGEWYEGGKFINTVPENKKREGSVKAKPRKIQIEPFVWVVSDRQPLFSIVGTGAQYIDRSDWKKGIKPYLPAFKNGVMYTGTTIEEVQALCDRFNAGERYR